MENNNALSVAKLEAMGKEFKTQIEGIINAQYVKANEEWNLNPYYHQSMAEGYSGGTTAYYRKEIDKLLESISQSGTNISSYWLQTGTPIMSKSEALEIAIQHFGLCLYIYYGVAGKPDDISKLISDTLKLIEQQQYEFWMMYFKYISFNELIGQPIEVIYKGIANDLGAYISGADDRILQHIINNHSLPDGVTPPKWIGRYKADASRFAVWCGMGEAAFNKCFQGKFIRANDRSIEKDGTISDILAKYKK